jgi:hypothetical protein
MFSSGRLLRQHSSEPDENSLGTADSRSHMGKAAACATWFATRSPLRVQAMVAPADRDEFGAEQALQQLAAIEMAAVVLVERRSSSSSCGSRLVPRMIPAVLFQSRVRLSPIRGLKQPGEKIM